MRGLPSKGAYPSNGGGAGAGPGAVAYEEETVDGGGGARKEPADGPESRPEAGTPDEVIGVDLVEIDAGWRSYGAGISLGGARSRSGRIISA